MPDPKNIEKDPDELVHEQQEELQDEPTGEDLDDLVHKIPQLPEEDESAEKDMDDLVHEADDGEDV